MSKKKGRAGNNPTIEVLQLRQMVSRLSLTANQLDAAKRALDNEASLVLQEMYEHIQKMDDFLIELEKRVIALEEKNEQGTDVSSEITNAATSEDGEGNI